MWPRPTRRLRRRTPNAHDHSPPGSQRRPYEARAVIAPPHRRSVAVRGRRRSGIGVRCRPVARPDRPRRHRQGHPAVHRDGEPPGHRAAGCGCPTGTRRPRGVRCDRQATRAGRGQPRTVPHARHPYRRADHQHRGHRPVRPHPRRRRDPDAARRPGGRPRVARRQRAPLPEPLAPPPPAVGWRGHRRRRRQHDRLSRPPAAGLDGCARRSGTRRIARAAGVGRVACGRDGRRRAAAGYAPGAASAVDEPVRVRTRNRRLRAVDRREGAFACQRPRNHRRPARPLGPARRDRPTRVDGERRGGAHRGAQAAGDPRRRARRPP